MNTPLQPTTNQPINNNEVEFTSANLRKEIMKILNLKISQLKSDIEKMTKERSDLLASGRRYRDNSGVNTYDQENNSWLLQRAIQQLDRLTMAKNRAESDPMFGICLDCHKPIPVPRLLEVPNTQHCTNCKS